MPVSQESVYSLTLFIHRVICYFIQQMMYLLSYYYVQVCMCVCICVYM